MLQAEARATSRRKTLKKEPMRARTKRNAEEYRITVRPLSKDEGGGYLVEYPEILGCMSDGETVEEAIAKWPRGPARLPGSF